MEMPEGWIRLNQFYLQHTKSDPRIAMDLLKEMAEALESELPNSLALHKFREWK